MRNFAILMATVFIGIVGFLAIAILNPISIKSPIPTAVPTRQKRHVSPTPTPPQKMNVTHLNLVKEIRLRRGVRSMATAYNWNLVYVPSLNEDLTYIIDTSTDTIQQRIPSKQPIRVAIHPLNSSFFITTEENYVLGYRGTKGQEFFSIQLDRAIDALAFAPDTDRLLVSHPAYNAVSVIDIQRGNQLTTIGTGDEPREMAYKSHRIYVANTNETSVSIISTQSLLELGQIPLPGLPNRIISDPKRERIYVSGQTDSYLWVIDTKTNRVTTTLPLASPVSNMEIDSRGDNLYLLDNLSNTLTVVDLTTSKPLRSIKFTSHFPLEVGITNLKLLENKHKFYLLNSITGIIYVYTF